MPAEDIYAIAMLMICGGGGVLGLILLGGRALAGLVVLAVLGWVLFTLLPSDARGGLVGTGVIGAILLGFARLGWLVARRWGTGQAVLALLGLGGLVLAGAVLMEFAPGQGFLANLGYVIGIFGLALPAAGGFAAGLGIAVLRRNRGGA